MSYYTLYSDGEFLTYSADDRLIKMNGMYRVWRYTQDGVFKAMSARPPGFLSLADKKLSDTPIEIGTRILTRIVNDNKSITFTVQLSQSGIDYTFGKDGIRARTGPVTVQGILSSSYMPANYCGIGNVWEDMSNTCVVRDYNKPCPKGSVWNSGTDSCVAPKSSDYCDTRSSWKTGLTKDEQGKKHCDSGSTWNNATKICEAPSGAGYCGTGTTWNSAKKICEAPGGAGYCGAGTTWNAVSAKCVVMASVCKKNTYWNTAADGCTATTLNCEAGYYNTETNTCQPCPVGKKYTAPSCVSTGGRRCALKGATCS